MSVSLRAPRVNPPRRLIAGVVGIVLIAAAFTIRVPPPPPRTAPYIKVMWRPAVEAREQSAKEAAYRLLRQQQHGERTWNYQLLDLSRENIRGLVTDPSVQDTDGLDRRAFRIAAPWITIAERVTGTMPWLERVAGPGFREWTVRKNAWPALLVIVWLCAVAYPRSRAVLFRGLPALSPTRLGLFRIALGVTLLAALPVAAELPDAPFPRALHRSADWFADWEWVHRLAEHSNVSSGVLTLAYVALALFTAGVLPRISYVVALVAITVRALVLLQHKSAHDWGLPLVVLWGLSIVPWNAGLTLVPRRGHGVAGDVRYGFAIWFPGLALGLAWLAAAYAKLDSSGIDWVLGGAVKYHFVEDFRQAPGTWGLWVAGRPALAVALSFAAIVVEALFVLHAFFPQPLVRLGFGVLGLGVLGGFYAMQGIFWVLWWVLLLAFLPYEPLAGLLRRGRLRQGVVSGFRPSRAEVALVAALVCVQIFASARRAEFEPLISDYGMYSWTWTSTEAFDRNNARKYRVYRYGVETGGGFVDITDRLRSLPKATDVLADALDRLRDRETLAPAQSEALRVIDRTYASMYGTKIDALAVLLDERAFDWTRGQFYDKTQGLRIGTIDLQSGAFVAASPDRRGS
jgi:hypothetical protein